MSKTIFNIFTSISKTLLLACFVIIATGNHAHAALPPAVGGDLSVLFAGEFSTIDPALAETLGERQSAALICEPLFLTDGQTVSKLLVYDWKTEEDGSSLRFWLRPGIQFHDGSTLTTKDVLASFERLLNKSFGSPHFALLNQIKGANRFRAGNASGISGFEIVSKIEFVITLTKPDKNFVHNLAHKATSILPARFAKSKLPVLKPIGTGAFKLQNINRQQIKLAAFAKYHGGKPYLESLAFISSLDLNDEKKARANQNAQATMAGRMKPGKLKHKYSWLGAEVIMRANPDMQNQTKKGADKFFKALFSCKQAVGLFEKRHVAPFKSQKKNKPVGGEIKAAGFGFNPYLEKIRESASYSCMGFKPDSTKAQQIYQQTFEQTLRIRVRKDMPELVLVAERIALVAESSNIPIKIIVLTADQMAQTSSNLNWDFELCERSVFKLPGKLQSKGDVILYRLPSEIIWFNERYLDARFDVFGLLDFASISRRVM